MNNQREFKVLTDREHVLKRPAVYIGSIEMAKDVYRWHYENEKMIYKEDKIGYVPALVKCFSEIVDNSIDVAVDYDYKIGNKISIEVTNKSFSVVDNGCGIPVKLVSTDELDINQINSKKSQLKQTRPCLAWTALKAGTSFNDDGRVKIGTNGMGVSLTNIFSKKFIGVSQDGKYKQTITCTENMTNIDASKITETKKSGCEVYCEPDLERFGLTEIDENTINIIRQHILDLSITYPKIKFTFNGDKMNIPKRGIMSMFGGDETKCENDNSSFQYVDGKFENGYIAFSSNTYRDDGASFYVCINGLNLSRGGSIVDYVFNQIVTPIREKLIKKYKDIKPIDIRSRLHLVLYGSNFQNLKFDTQTKEAIVNENSEITKYFGDYDFAKLAKSVLACDEIINPIVDMFKLKEELKSRQSLKLNKRNKPKISVEKYLPPIGNKNKYLALCEGRSASSGISQILGREGIGYYAMRGLPINVVNSSINKVANNQEFKDVISILGLDISSNNDKQKTIIFDKVLITTDSDLDGNHVSSMIIGWFYKFAPHLFTEGKICKLNTPIVFIENKKSGKIDKFFMNLNDFKEWEKNHELKSNQRYIYSKGLGSLEKAHMQQLISEYGIDYFLQTFTFDDKADESICVWLNDDVKKRKDILKSYSGFNIDMI